MTPEANPDTARLHPNMPSVADKFLQPCGATLTLSQILAGETGTGCPDTAALYANMPSIPDKFVQPCGRTLTLGQIINEAGGGGGGTPQSTQYTLGEVDTGMRWVDGKPIFRQVIQVTTAASGDTTVALGTTIESLISIDGSLISTLGSIIPFGYLNLSTAENLTAIVNVQRNSVVVRAAGVTTNPFSNRPITVIVEYTKV